MIRVLIFMGVVFALALGAAWVAERPGIISLDWQGYRIEMGVMTALVIVAAAFVVVHILWGMLRTVLRSPDIASRFWRRRKKDRGYDALSKGLVALGVGDAPSARRYGAEAAKLLKGEPAAKLLLAQTAQLSGDREEARRRFEDMLEDPRLKAVGLHGLFIEAERLDEPVAARHYAEEAAELVPGLPWAGRAVLGYQAMGEDWEKAQRTLERNYAAKLIDKKTFRRHKAVIMTARAMELEDREPDHARQLAHEAHGLAPDLVPAAALAARLFTRRGEIRKTLKIVETTWKMKPHPDLADAYAHARTGDSAQDRLARVKSLAALRPNSTDGALAVAIAAIEASDWGLAREKLAGVLRSNPTRRACLLMAELEEKENGDRGRVREWLSRAVRAPADPTWVADGIVSDEWAPVSPLSGRLDAFEWTQPPATHPEDELETIDESLLAALPGLPEKKPEPVTRTPVEAPPAAVKEAATKPAAEPVKGAQPEPAKSEKAEKVTAEAEIIAPEKPASLDAEKAKVDEPKPAEKAQGSGDGPQRAKVEAAKVETIDFPLKHMPDDPGPEEKEEAAAKGGFRFFN